LTEDRLKIICTLVP